MTADEDDTTAPPAPSPAGDEEPAGDDESGALTLAALDAKLDRLAERLTAWMRGGRRPAAGDEAADVATQVRAELDRVNASTERARRGSVLNERIARIEEQLRAATEKPPVQYRKVELRMGWVDPQ
jgi:hypothetical protein